MGNKKEEWQEWINKKKRTMNKLTKVTKADTTTSIQRSTDNNAETWQDRRICGESSKLDAVLTRLCMSYWYVHSQRICEVAIYFIFPHTNKCDQVVIMFPIKSFFLAVHDLSFWELTPTPINNTLHCRNHTVLKLIYQCGWCNVQKMLDICCYFYTYDSMPLKIHYIHVVNY